MASTYEERQAARRERLERAAAAARSKAEEAFGASRRAVAGIEPGQPILVGHHSERKHRRAVERANQAMRRGVDASDRAERLAAQAAAVGTAGVSSDDPEAVAKLTAELARLTEKREAFRAHNAKARREGTELLPAFMLTNLGAKIRRVEKRIAELRQHVDAMAAHAAGEAAIMEPISGDARHGGTYRIEVLAERNRIALSCSERLPRETYQALRSRGWRWAPSEGAFLYGANNRGIARAREAAEMIGVTL